MSSISLSVVIPTHDTRRLVLRCLESLSGGGVTPFEIIVVDDASSDGTAEEIRRRAPSVTVIENERCAGFTLSANRGLAAATGEILLLLNSDTEVIEGSLDALMESFAKDPGLGVAGAELRYPDGTAQWSAGREPTRLWLFGQASGLPALLGKIPGYRLIKPPGRAAGTRVDWVSGAAMALRRETWRAVGPLDEGYLFYGQDLDLCLTARDAGWRVEVVRGFVVTHHHGATISSSGGTAAPYHPARMWSDLVRVVAKRRGADAGGRAAAAIRAGARLRLAGRRVLQPFIAENRRADWRAETAAFAAGLESLRPSPKP